MSWWYIEILGKRPMNFQLIDLTLNLYPVYGNPTSVEGKCTTPVLLLFSLNFLLSLAVLPLCRWLGLLRFSFSLAAAEDLVGDSWSCPCVWGVPSMFPEELLPSIWSLPWLSIQCPVAPAAPVLGKGLCGTPRVRIALIRLLLALYSSSSLSKLSWLSELDAIVIYAISLNTAEVRAIFFTHHNNMIHRPFMDDILFNQSCYSKILSHRFCPALIHAAIWQLCKSVHKIYRYHTTQKKSHKLTYEHQHWKYFSAVKCMWP